jgi:hypothetical protein
MEPIWVAVAVIGASQYLVLRSLKRYTTLLEVAGR